jgi:hypothetical protein
MRRFFVLIILAILVFWAVRATRPRPLWHAPPPSRWNEPRWSHDGPAGREFAAETHRQAREALAEARHAVDEARHEVRQAYRQARAEIRQAWSEASAEVRKAYSEVLECDAEACSLQAPTPVAAPAREPAEGLPVPIVPGTHVTEAEPRPPAPPIPPVPPRPVVVVSHGKAPQPPAVAPAAPAQAQPRTIEGQISVSEERARNDARRALRESVVQWLGPEVPHSWSPPARLVEAMILDTQTEEFVRESGPLKDLGPLYVAKVSADFSPQRRAGFVEAYTHDLVQYRLTRLGAALAFILICLAALSGYIRADEATKGYYTNRLRMLAAAGVGAAGAIIYNMVV